MKNFKYKFINLAFILLFSVIPLMSFAQDTGSGGPLNSSSTTLKNPLKYETINEFLKAIVEGVLKLGIPIIVLAIIYSGFLFVTALGNPTKLEKAKEAFLYTVIGAAILLGSWGLAQLISETIIQISK